jgi:hypothetical protein
MDDLALDVRGEFSVYESRSGLSTEIHEGWCWARFKESAAVLKALALGESRTGRLKIIRWGKESATCKAGRGQLL